MTATSGNSLESSGFGTDADALHLGLCVGIGNCSRLSADLLIEDSFVPLPLWICRRHHDCPTVGIAIGIKCQSLSHAESNQNEPQNSGSCHGGVWYYSSCCFWQLAVNTRLISLRLSSEPQQTLSKRHALWCCQISKLRRIIQSWYMQLRGIDFCILLHIKCEDSGERSASIESEFRQKSLR